MRLQYRLGVIGLLVTCGHARAAAAGQFEVSGSFGSALDSDRQSIAYRVTLPPTSIVSFQTPGPVEVTTDGRLVVALAAGWRFRPNVSLEGRMDSIELGAAASEVRYAADVALPGFLPSAAQQLTVGPARLTFDRPVVLSVGLRLQPGLTWGRVSWTAAAGLSYRPPGDIVATEPISLGALTINGRTLALPIALPAGDVRIHARAPGRAGGHVAAGLDIQLSPRVHLRPEVRYIRLRSSRVQWTEVSAPTPLGPLGAAFGEPRVSLAPFAVPSAFPLLQTALVVRF